MVKNGIILLKKKMSALLREITSIHDGDFYCLTCLHSYSTKDKLKKHKDVYENHHYCYIEMPKEDNKILKYNHGEKSMKVQFIIYVDLKSLLEKMFIDSFRFMSSSLSSLANNLSEELHCSKCIDCKSYLDSMITKYDQFIFRCFKFKTIRRKISIKI